LGESADRTRAYCADCVARQLIGALIEPVARVPLQPMPPDLVLCRYAVEALPEIHILHRFLVGRAPAIAFPLMNPAHHSACGIFAVRVQVDQARPLERFEGRGGISSIRLFVV
jgi:hypothetical protein